MPGRASTRRWSQAAGITQTYGETQMTLQGTSVAAPAVAGAAALMLQANPGLTPPLIKAILQYTAQPIPGASLLQQGAGLLNIEARCALAQALRTDIGRGDRGRHDQRGRHPAGRRQDDAARSLDAQRQQLQLVAHRLRRRQPWSAATRCSPSSSRSTTRASPGPAACCAPRWPTSRSAPSAAVEDRAGGRSSSAMPPLSRRCMARPGLYDALATSCISGRAAVS